MRYLQLPVYLCFALTFFVLSCKKNAVSTSGSGSTGGTGNTTTPGDSIVVNLDYEISGSRNYELIISEPGGKILLDTLTVSNTTISATLHTGQPMLDLTRIYTVGDSNMAIYTFKGVNLANWHNLEFDMYDSYGGETNNTPATITYTNLPNLSPLNFMFANPLAVSYNGGYGSNTLTLQYDMASSKYDYLLLPPVGLYNLHIPTSINDTADLTHMDTATRLSYALPAGYSYSYTVLVGIQDTTDKTKSLQLSNGGLNYPSGTQLELPSIPFQQYVGEVDATLSPNETGVYNYSGDSVQLNIPFFAAGSYSLSSIDVNNVEPVFSTKPTRYMSSWSVNAYIVFNIYSSPDSVEHPSALINSVASQSRMLKGISVRNLTLGGFSYYNTDDMSYSAYFQKASNFKLGTDQPIRKEISYYKNY